MKKLFSSTASICAIAAVIGFFLGTPALAQMAGGPTSAVPAQLQPPAPAAPLLRANAQGSQIYTCTAKPGGAGFEWTFKAPEATLSDASGKPKTAAQWSAKSPRTLRRLAGKGLRGCCSRPSRTRGPARSPASAIYSV